MLTLKTVVILIGLYKPVLSCVTTIDRYAWVFDANSDTLISGISTPEKCFEECIKSDSCQGYTWQHQNFVDICLLMKTLRSLEYCGDSCTSGTTVENVAGGCTGEADHIIDEVTATNVQDCWMSCVQEPQCTSFTWFNQSSMFKETCFLFSSCSEVQDCIRCLSGRLLCIEDFIDWTTSYPTGSTSYPTGSSSYPTWSTGSTNYPTGSTNYPTGSTNYPTGSSSYPTGSTNYPTGSSSHPTWSTGSSNYPTGSSSHPTWSTGSSNYPTGSSSYPTWSTGSTYYPTGSSSHPTWSSGSTNYPTGRPTYVSSTGSSSYPTWSTNYPTGSSQYPTGSSQHSTDYTSVPTGRPTYYSSTSYTGTGYPTGSTQKPTTGVTGYPTGSHVPLPAQCSNYKLLNDVTRSVNSSYNYYCDESSDRYTSPDWVGTGYYRVVSPAGNFIADYSNGIQRCGTNNVGYLLDQHPQEAGRETDARVCFQGTSNGGCDRTIDVKITNCIDYYVYYLIDVFLCSSRYCGTEKLYYP